MLKKSLWLAVSVAMAAQAAPFALAELQPEPLQSHVAHLTADLITRYHYKAMPLDDALSEKIFDNYLKSLDADKLVFLQADIDQLAATRTGMDNAIIDEDLRIPFAIFNLYAQRMAERIAHAHSLLQEGFDFGLKENHQYARARENWPKSEGEMRELWRKRVKNDWLRLKLAGKDDQSIVATLDKRYDAALTRVGRLKSEDAFQTFMNAYTTAIEPHTTYKGPRAAEDSGILMKLSLVGIGTVLTEKDGYITIRELVPGGPSALSGQLKIGDRIVGVAQGESSAMTDIQGWRMDDIVVLLRGAADSTVVLDVLPADAATDGKRQLISLIRKKIALEDQVARKTILSVTEGNAVRRIGVISLPSFYQDYQARQKGDRNFRSAAHDVARLLGELKNEQIDAVLIDLRNNGGGSMDEAIELTGLFVGQGPVVQQLDAKGKLTVERAPQSAPVWEGRLGVLINRGSASASEIFAAAIQDYGRGLVIGETSYGKGTVQAVISLDQAAGDGLPKLGELRLTIAQFFRINGTTTQLRGVSPDIPLPKMSDTEGTGESGFDNPLPWIRIKAADYVPAGDVKFLLPALLRRHKARVRADKDFAQLAKEFAELDVRRRNPAISLNEAERRRERSGEAPDDGLLADERNLAAELATESARKAAKDAYLNEAVHILSDAADLPRPGFPPVAGRARRHHTN